ncbi:NAD-dependent epimerase/dehydratase family protein [Trinickia dinghuensis]|uniref:NAD(P)-dependent oxidoreductase n=1 Tax=Trinickia dinghuensis TaxID=2291023 RepID=A0A3D8JUY5_9BURK|nr:NAD(P)-dependent oxidoreductase [Trinickia dinghuensis]RDU96211.1 NAD(P)-dependent oxidoreductase [Trinickia dinghuensis]
MKEKVFLAGAAGAVGAVLTPLLVESGYEVYGTTRHLERMDGMREAGAHPVLVDVFDRETLANAIECIAPSIVIHQLTDLPPGLDPKRMSDATVRNARIRGEGTANLVSAARAAGCERIVAQSIAWAYAPGATPHAESQPLDLGTEGARAVTVVGVAALERWVLSINESGGIGTVLRYGNLYGPGTGRDAPQGASPLHVEAAAWAALLAVQRSTGGVFNVAENGAEVTSEKAKRELGWRPDMRLQQHVAQ